MRRHRNLVYFLILSFALPRPLPAAAPVHPVRIEPMAHDRYFPAIARKLQRWLDELEMTDGPVVQATVGDEVWGKGYLEYRQRRQGAAEAFHRGKTESARRWRRAAWQSTPPAWLEAEAGEEGAFARFWQEGEREVSRTCRVQLVGVSPQSRVFWNGFPVKGAEKAIYLSGLSHELRVEARGYEPVLRQVDCTAGGERIVQVPQLPAAADSGAEATLLWVDSQQNEVKLYLYTPGVAFHPVPSERPIRVADIVNQVRIDLPIAESKMRALLQQHRWASLSARDVAGTSDLPRAVAPALESPRWYENWKLWALVGVVGAGIAGSLIALRSGSVDGNQKRQ